MEEFTLHNTLSAGGKSQRFHHQPDLTNESLEDEDFEDHLNRGSEEAASSEGFEIPIWLRGEPRWISGITEATQARDLAEALLANEGLLQKNTVIDEYVITERWKKIEKILVPEAKILKIWRAWGTAQREVKLTLRRVQTVDRESSAVGHHHTKEMGTDDSGRDSPTGSAIVRRRKYRAFKSKQPNTTEHPKSQKAVIEKLMKLILNQGETIQLQLARLKDRELQISEIEDERHRIRSVSHGKDYLLETYLNGLREAQGDEICVETSDSGVPTEDTYASNLTEGVPCDTAIAIEPVIETSLEEQFNEKSHWDFTKRESELLRDHKKLQGSGVLESVLQSPLNTSDNVSDPLSIKDQIVVLEKIYALNKHIQDEEELLVRLNAKKVRIESQAESQDMTKDEILITLNRLNLEIEQRSQEIETTDKELEQSEELLVQKTNIVQDLDSRIGKIYSDDDFNIYMSHQRQLKGLDDEQRSEDIYDISKLILKNSVAVVPSTSMAEEVRNESASTSGCFKTTVQIHQQPIFIQNHLKEEPSFHGARTRSLRDTTCQNIGYRPLIQPTPLQETDLTQLGTLV